MTPRDDTQIPTARADTPLNVGPISSVSIRVAVAAAILGYLSVLAWTALSPSDRVVVSNGANPEVFVVDLNPGDVACDGLGVSERSADILALTIGTYDAPAQPFRLKVGHADPVTVSQYQQGIVEVPVAAMAPRGERACLRNVGKSRIAVAGAHRIGRATVNGQPTSSFALSFELRDRSPPIWLHEARPVIARVGRTPYAPAGAATGWLAAACFLGSATAALTASLWVRRC